jgi:quinol monooxygenase YgiN
MIHVLAHITAHPGRREEILAAYRVNRPAVLAEAGCIEYRAVIDARNGAAAWANFGPDTFIVVEKWESPEALKAHAAAPHMLAYGAKVKDLTAKREIHVMEEVAD